MEINVMDPLLYEAAATGDLRFLKEVGDGDRPVDFLLQKTPNNNNVLHIAAQFKHTHFFREFPNQIQSPLFGAINIKGDTPMHIAARVGCVEVVEFLIDQARKLQTDAAADVETGPTDAEGYKELLRMTNSEKDTALHVAVKGGHRDVVVLLMDADPELCSYTNNANESPLFLAITKGFPKIGSCILDKSPSCLSFQGVKGVTALHAAVTRISTCKGIVEMTTSKHPEIIKAVDELGWTPLHYAALKGNVEAVRFLIQGDSSVAYILDKCGMSALHVAAHSGRIQVIKELVRLRPDTCDLLNHKGQTALHSAVLGEKRNVVTHILKTPKPAGLANVADNEGNTPLHMAASIPNLGILRTLARDPKVDRTATNDQSSKAIDIFLGNNIELDTFGRGKLFWGRSIGVPNFQRYVRHDLMKLKSSAEENAKSTAATSEYKKAAKALLDESKIFDTNLLVAVLIATVTFSAPLTMPGGFHSNGMAILHRRIFFIVFVLSDTTSFLLSLFVVYNHFMVSNVSRVYLATPSLYIRYAIAALLVAFASGISAVLPKYSPLSILVILICIALCFFIFIKIRFAAPQTMREMRKRLWLRSRVL